MESHTKSHVEVKDGKMTSEYKKESHGADGCGGCSEHVKEKHEVKADGTEKHSYKSEVKK